MKFTKYTYVKDNCGNIRCTICDKHTDLIVKAKSQREADETMQNIGGHCATCLPNEIVIMTDK